MRRGWAIVATILGVLLVVGIAAGAYHAGVDAGVRQGVEPGHVVEVVGGPFGHAGFGFFPFGFLFFPLFLFGIFFLVRGAFWRRRWDGDHGHPHWGPGGGGSGRFEDWHRRQHEQSSGDHPGSGGEPSHV